MIILFNDLRKADSVSESEALKRLKAFLSAHEPNLIRFLSENRFRLDNIVTYAELRDILLSGVITPELVTRWQQQYSLAVAEILEPVWLLAARTIGSETESRRPGFIFDPSSQALLDWTSQRAAALVKHCTEEAKKGLRAAIKASAYANEMSVDELAQVVRPMIGLTKPQVVANRNFYNRLIESGMSSKRAAERSANYAARQHRYRAQMIARTETATAYNHAQEEVILQAQKMGYMGKVRKVWCTADDERTCEICGALEGKTVSMTGKYSAGGKTICRFPPAHPQCRCTLIYEEVSKPEKLAA